jgi:hypothetical protein
MMPLREFVLMQIHADALAAEGDTFTLQTHFLLEPGFTGEANLSTRPEHAMPRQSAGRSQRPNHLACRSGESRRGGNLTVGRDLAFGNLQDDSADLGEHPSSINEKL